MSKIVSKFAFEVPHGAKYPGARTGLTKVGHTFDFVEDVTVVRNAEQKFVLVRCNTKVDAEEEKALTKKVRAYVHDIQESSDTSVKTAEKILKAHRGSDTDFALCFFYRPTFVSQVKQ